MKKIYVSLVLIVLISFSASVNAQVFDLSSTKRLSLNINQDFPAVYKPSKLIMGTKTKFIIKAAPESHVSLVTSEENNGAPLFYGQKLRLGQVSTPNEGIVGDKGIIELEVAIPDRKELVGKILYFEVLVWKNSDYSDLKIAKIRGIDGRETDINAVVIVTPPKKEFLPGIGTTIPGTNFNINKAMEMLNKAKNSDADNSENYYQEEMFNNDDSLMLRNLHAPELKKDK